MSGRRLKPPEKLFLGLNHAHTKCWKHNWIFYFLKIWNPNIIIENQNARFKNKRAKENIPKCPTAVRAMDGNALRAGHLLPGGSTEQTPVRPWASAVSSETRNSASPLWGFLQIKWGDVSESSAVTLVQPYVGFCSAFSKFSLMCFYSHYKKT